MKINKIFILLFFSIQIFLPIYNMENPETRRYPIVVEEFYRVLALRLNDIELETVKALLCQKIDDELANIFSIEPIKEMGKDKKKLQVDIPAFIDGILNKLKRAEGLGEYQVDINSFCSDLTSKKLLERRIFKAILQSTNPSLKQQGWNNIKKGVLFLASALFWTFIFYGLIEPETRALSLKALTTAGFIVVPLQVDALLGKRLFTWLNPIAALKIIYRGIKQCFCMKEKEFYFDD